jgi:hypothetical protein
LSASPAGLVEFHGTSLLAVHTGRTMITAHHWIDCLPVPGHGQPSSCDRLQIIAGPNRTVIGDVPTTPSIAACALFTNHSHQATGLRSRRIPTRSPSSGSAAFHAVRVLSPTATLPWPGNLQPTSRGPAPGHLALCSAQPTEAMRPRSISATPDNPRRRS